MQKQFKCSEFDCKICHSFLSKTPKITMTTFSKHRAVLAQI